MEKIQALQHPTNKSLKVSEVFPVYPDWENWSNEYYQTSFDAHPLRNELKMAEPTEEEKLKLEESLLKPIASNGGYNDPHNKMFLSYYVPNEKSLETIDSKRKLREQFGEDVEEVEGQEYQYDFVRDFDYEAKVESHTQEQKELDDHHGTLNSKGLFFLLRPRLGAFYNYLNTKLTLRRRRAKVIFYPLFLF